MSTGLSLRTRALLAVALLVGFYVLALGIVGALAYLPYAEWALTHRLHLKFIGFCAVGAFLILKGVVPRPDRFEPPGPRLTADAHPRLFALVDEVAAATGQAPPAEVYLVPNVNAWVSERGGVMGFGGRRVMGIGLPLLELLSVEELRWVIAHEFGHYVSGDTSLGPWIYKTRAALGRTVRSLEEHSEALAKPFQWYGAAFLRITHAVSRAQEYVADATASRVAGREAGKRTLVAITGGAGAFDAYWGSELAPTLERGFRPPFAAGFRQFLAAPAVAPQVAALVDRRLADEETDRYDTHPCVRDRLTALERAHATAPAAAPAIAPREGDESPATSLLADLDAAEVALVATMGPPDHRLTPIAWDAVPATVLPIGWREAVREAAPALAGLTPERLPELARAKATEEHRRETAGRVGAALSLALLRRAAAGDPAGLRLEAPPGEPVRFLLGATEIQPFAVCARLADGSLDAAAWGAQCEAAGIAGVDLGGVAADAPAAAQPSAAHA